MTTETYDVLDNRLTRLERELAMLRAQMDYQASQIAYWRETSRGLEEKMKEPEHD